MNPFQTLLLATDFSSGAQETCRYVQGLLELTGARLHVVHVVTELVDRRRKRLTDEVLQSLSHEVVQLAEEELAAFCHQHFAPHPYTTRIAAGVGFREILLEAERVGADLIILGSTGRSALEQVLIGSTAERVVRNSPIPVLTVPHRPSSPRDARA